MDRSHQTKVGQVHDLSLYSAVMWTRRRILGGLAAAALCPTRSFAKAAQPATAVNFAVPPHACDCHTHIFADTSHFPLFPGRTYTPEPASPEEMAALHRALHLQRVVVVTPSIYGTDNSATLYGMRARKGAARGVAVIDEKTPERDLDAMQQAGVRGIRVNLATAGAADPAAGRERVRAAIERVKNRKWHVQVYANLASIVAMKELVRDSPVAVVFDHFGGAKAALGLEQPGFGDLIELVRSGKSYVKISAAYRSSTRPPDYADAAPLAQALIEANADRILWGTDWPHPDTAAPRAIAETTPLLQIDDGRMLNQLARWAPDAAVRKKILVDNPARLYGW
jgi:predicted TIM-barrel fold metal-dependent hydrolase